MTVLVDSANEQRGTPADRRANVARDIVHLKSQTPCAARVPLGAVDGPLVVERRFAGLQNRVACLRLVDRRNLLAARQTVERVADDLVHLVAPAMAAGNEFDAPVFDRARRERDPNRDLVVWIEPVVRIILMPRDVANV